MADIRIKDLATTAAASSADDYIAIDGTTNGTRKLSAATPSFTTSVTVPLIVASGSDTATAVNTGGLRSANFGLSTVSGGASYFGGAVNAASAATATAPLTGTNNASGISQNVGAFLAPSASTFTNVGTGPYLSVGVANSQHNSSVVQHLYAGAGSSSNLAQFGTYGGTMFSVSGAGDAVVRGTTPATTSTSAALQVAGGIYAGAASVFGSTMAVGAGTNIIRLTNAGGDVGLASLTATSATTNGFGVYSDASESSTAYTVYNGTRQISVASIGTASVTTTAGAETANLVFKTKPAGSAAVTALTISGATQAATFAGAVTQSTSQGWGVVSTATAAGTTTLTTSSKVVQVFTGSTTQNVQLPAANVFGAGVGCVYIVKNRSSGTVTVLRAGADTIDGATTQAVATGNAAMLVSNGVDTWHVV